MSEESSLEALKTLPFSLPRQEALLGYLIMNDKFFAQASIRLRPEWFLNIRCSQVYDLLQKEATGLKRHPRKDELLESRTLLLAAPEEAAGIRNQIEKCCASASLFGLDSLTPELTDWLHARIYTEKIRLSTEVFNRVKDTKTQTDTSKKLHEAFDILRTMTREVDDITFEPGTRVEFANYAKDFEAITAEIKGALTFGVPAMDKLLQPPLAGTTEAPTGCLLRGDTTILLAPSNIGKCLGKDTELLRFSGEKVLVQDVRSGDLLMGPDGKPRRVLSTTTGRGPMFRVTPNAGGVPFVCNDAHVLSLKCGKNNVSHKTYTNKDGETWTREYCNMDKGEIVNIPLKEFVKKSRDYQNRMRLWRASLDFSEKKLPIDPYILGVWLGDGHSNTAAVTTMDDEIALAWEHWLRDTHGHSVSVHGAGEACTYAAVGAGTAIQALRDLGVLISGRGENVVNHKHIPHQYLTASRSQRLELLAGLIDTDGHYTGDAIHAYEITQKHARLANDICFLAGSLGFKVSDCLCQKSCQTGTVGTYHRLTIMGPVSQVPVRLDRKRGLDAKKDPSVTGFKITPIGDGDYYGFTLDGDHLFLLSDFTVTHNTSTMVTIACHNIKAGKNVLFITHEGRPADIQLKIWQCMTGKTRVELLSLFSDPAKKQAFDYVASLLDRRLLYVPMNKAGLCVEEVAAAIQRHLDKFKADHGESIDLIVDDYLSILTTNQNARGQLQRRQQDEVVYKYGVQIALEHNCHLLTAIQTNREGSKTNNKQGGTDRLLVMEDVSESWGPMQSATNVISINRDPIAQARSRVTFHICKSRSSEVGWAVVCRSNFPACVTHSAEYGATWYRGNGTMADRIDQLLSEHMNSEIPLQKIIDG